ncbi:M-phase phosphoprotein 9 [Mactra antiquata]
MSTSPSSSSPRTGDVINDVENDQNVEGGREAADGGPNEADVVVTDDNNSASSQDGTDTRSKEQINAYRDLDKDIDAMLENSVKNDLVNHNENSNDQNGNADITMDSNVDMSRNVEGSVSIEASSEKSFTSDATDSSALAESVVKRVIGSAIEQIQAGTEAGPSTAVNVPEVKPSDIKVGLFQYQDDGISSDSDEDNDDIDDGSSTKETNVSENSSQLATQQPKDSMVGLFQYMDMDEADRTKSPESLEADTENIDSVNEEERENILQLYGLEGIDPISPKSASPDESGPDSLEGKGSVKIVDVQREIYEPTTRLFSVTRDTSSSESTPRLENGNSNKSVDNVDNETDEVIVRDDGRKEQFDEQKVIEDSENASSNANDDEYKPDKYADTKTDVNVKEAADKESEGETKTTTQSVSPPLVQYESVMENGKFRIIKTSKEGFGIGYPGIRVGDDILSPKESPRSVESQKESPRANDFEKSEPAKESSSPRDVVEDVLDDNVPRLQLEQVLRNSESLGADNEQNAVRDDEREVIGEVELDREKIRKLLENENNIDTDIGTRVEMKGGRTSQDSGLPRSQHSEGVDESDRKSPRQLSLSELQTSTSRDKSLSMEADMSRIKYTTRDTTGREVKRTGPKPYDVQDEGDKLTSDSRFVDSFDRPVYGRESNESNHTSSSYENELLRRAYDRVSSQKVNKPHVSPQRSQDTSSVIPGFKTLQDQQAKWSDMFNTLEAEHRRELRGQYEKHQYNIQRLQQQMELELQKQHLAIRKKLDIHKEALAKMSPDRDGTRRYRSPDQSTSPRQLSPERLHAERPTTGQSGLSDLTTLQSSFDKKSWREIYREVREEEERSPSPSRPLKRSLDNDFESMESTLDRSRPTGRRSSPRGSSDLSRSGSRERPREVTLDNSHRRSPVNVMLTKGDRDRSINSSRSPRSRVKERPRSPPESRDSRSPYHSADGGEEGVSRHVKQLLDTLSDTRHGLQGIQDDITTDRSHSYTASTSTERPRAGVYSSPMPFVSKSRFSQSTCGPVDNTVTDESSRLTQSLPISRGDRAEFYDDRTRKSATGATSTSRDYTPDSSRFDDSCLSPSTRMNLREKHSKHLADLRAYYEDELRELRKALSDSLDASNISADMIPGVTSSQGQGHMFDMENRRLMEKCRALEDENEELIMKLQALEQKNHGLEKRASEYASAFTDTQAMSIQHRAHIEELQRYCRERDDLINELESKKLSNEDSVKIYKKNLDDEMELHRQDKISLQRMMDRYDGLDREYKLLQETMNATENKLYETRTEVVELNRTISKLELENKRLGRENDNLRHKVTQSLNLSTLHESFGGPSSPRGEAQNKSRSPASASLNIPDTDGRPGTIDHRVPGFSTTVTDWTPQKSRPKSADVNKSRNDVSQSSRHSGMSKEKKESRTKRKENRESVKGRQSENSSSAPSIKDSSSVSSSREDVSHRSRPREADQVPERDKTTTTTTKRERTPPRREITPTRSMSPSSQADSEVSDYSPLLKAERELFKLRDMMRQAVAVKPSLSPPQPKLQKKFYGSERPVGKDEYAPDLNIPRGRKEKPSICSHNSVVKSKGNQTPSKPERSSDKSSGKSNRSGASKSEKSSKTRDRREGKDAERREKGPERERERAVDKDRSQHSDGDRLVTKNEDYDTPTRFDISINEDKKTLTVTPRKSVNQSGKLKNLFNGDGSGASEPTGQVASKASSSGANGQVENTLDMMRNGQYTTRPEWENVYTSLAKQKNENQEKVKTMEEKVADRLKQISEMESRYDGLQAEKQQLESSINKIPLHGRVDRNNRRHKEEMEDRLDSVVKELGSLRMSLKRYNVLKTTG